MNALARFQDAFAHALRVPDAGAAVEIAALTAQPAFAVYRNTVVKGCIDALQANFPAVARLVGEEWFRAAAALYVREALPADPTLLRYGETFPDFLARFEPAAKLPYLPGVARLDRYWTEAHAAADARPLEPAAIAQLDAETIGATKLEAHPAARWAWFPEGPIYTIWSRNREEAALGDDLEWQPEGALIVRPHAAVAWRTLDAAGCAFLDACAAGATFAAAADAAAGVRADVDLGALLAVLIESGALAPLANDQQFLEEQP